MELEKAIELDRAGRGTKMPFVTPLFQGVVVVDDSGYHAVLSQDQSTITNMPYYIRDTPSFIDYVKQMTNSYHKGRLKGLDEKQQELREILGVAEPKVDTEEVSRLVMQKMAMQMFNGAVPTNPPAQVEQTAPPVQAETVVQVEEEEEPKPLAPPTNKGYTDEDVEIILSLKIQGKRVGMDTVAKHLNRSVNAISQKRMKLLAAQKKNKKRDNNGQYANEGKAYTEEEKKIILTRRHEGKDVDDSYIAGLLHRKRQSIYNARNNMKNQAKIDSKKG